MGGSRRAVLINGKNSRGRAVRLPTTGGKHHSKSNRGKATVELKGQGADKWGYL